MLRVVSQKLFRGCLSPATSLRTVTTTSHDLSRHKDYGYEEGHDLKNEVRKEKWIRKRRGPAPTGRKWRLDNNLPPEPLMSQIIAIRPDWSFKDGTPGHLNSAQAESVHIMADMCQEVQDTLKFMGADAIKAASKAGSASQK